MERLGGLERLEVEGWVVEIGGWVMEDTYCVLGNDLLRGLRLRLRGGRRL